MYQSFNISPCLERYKLTPLVKLLHEVSKNKRIYLQIFN